MKLVVLVVLVLLSAGCTSMQVSQNLASGAIGCSPESIVIENEDVDNGVHTFSATCHGKQYYCTYMYPNPISCKAASTETSGQAGN